MQSEIAYRSDLYERAAGAITFFANKTDIAMPRKLAGWGPIKDMTNGTAATREAIAQVDHFCAFMQQAAISRDCGHLRFFIRRCMKHMYAGGTSTIIELWKVAENFSTPEAASAVLHKVETEAELELDPYRVFPSKSSIAAVLHHWMDPEADMTEPGKKIARETLLVMLEKEYFLSHEQIYTEGGEDCLANRIFEIAAGIKDARTQPPAIRQSIGKALLAKRIKTIAEFLA